MEVLSFNLSSPKVYPKPVVCSPLSVDLSLGVPATPSGFPLYLCSLHSRPAPKTRTSLQIPLTSPKPVHSQRMPLQSLTLFGGVGSREREQGMGFWISGILGFGNKVPYSQLHHSITSQLLTINCQLLTFNFQLSIEH